MFEHLASCAVVCGYMSALIEEKEPVTMNTEDCPLTRALAEKLLNEPEYVLRYQAMYFHAKGLEISLNQLKEEFRKMEKVALNDIPARELKKFLSRYSTYFRD